MTFNTTLYQTQLDALSAVATDKFDLFNMWSRLMDCYDQANYDRYIRELNLGIDPHCANEASPEVLAAALFNIPVKATVSAF